MHNTRKCLPCGKIPGSFVSFPDFFRFSLINFDFHDFFRFSRFSRFSKSLALWKVSMRFSRSCTKVLSINYRRHLNIQWISPLTLKYLLNALHGTQPDRHLTAIAHFENLRSTCRIPDIVLRESEGTDGRARISKSCKSHCSNLPTQMHRRLSSINRR